MRRLDRGYFTAGRLHHAPVRIHWATPIGMFVLTGFAIVPSVWAAFLVIILVHEAGHAYFVRHFRLSVVSIDVHGLGGVCRWQGHASDIAISIIAWGGVLAQLALLAVTEIVARVLQGAGGPLVGAILVTLTATNIAIILLNLLPFPGFDGFDAWRLFRPRNFKQWFGRRARLKAKESALQRELAALEARRRERDETTWLN
jgi:Zn-dependent protease